MTKPSQRAKIHTIEKGIPQRRFTKQNIGDNKLADLEY
jgi:hypothetical protein